MVYFQQQKQHTANATASYTSDYTIYVKTGQDVTETKENTNICSFTTD